MNREEIMNFFRSDEFIEALTECDKQEIALHCVSYSDKIYTKIEKIFKDMEK